MYFIKAARLKNLQFLFECTEKELFSNKYINFGTVSYCASLNYYILLCHSKHTVTLPNLNFFQTLILIIIWYYVQTKTYIKLKKGGTNVSKN